MKRALLLFLLLPFLAAQTPTEVEVTAEPSHHLALENEYVRVFKVEVAPHRSTLMHRHRHDYLYVTLGDAHISNEVEGKPPVDVKLADGDTRFAAGNFAHVARNLSRQPFRNVTIELLQDEKWRQMPSHWPEESGEKTFAGGRIKILFVKDGVRVSEVNLEPGAVVPSHRHDGTASACRPSPTDAAWNQTRGSAGRRARAAHAANVGTEARRPRMARPTLPPRRDSGAASGRAARHPRR